MIKIWFWLALIIWYLGYGTELAWGYAMIGLKLSVPFIIIFLIRFAAELFKRRGQFMRPRKERAGGESGKRFGGGLVPGRLENESGAQRGD